MSIWASIVQKIREIISKMIGSRTLEQTLHVTPAISSEMEKSVILWDNMYKDQAPWLHEPDFTNPVRVASLGLPAMIASEKARTALLEFESKITPKTKQVEVNVTQFASGTTPGEEGLNSELGNLKAMKEEPVGNTERADFLNSQYDKLKEKLRTQIEYGIAKGGLIIKPYPYEKIDANGNSTTELEFDYIQADNYFPIAFDASGKVTEAAFLQTKVEGSVVYRRLEYHKWSNGKVVIVNKAFKSTDNNIRSADSVGVDLGTEIPLTEISEWATIQPKTEINNVEQPLFAYFKMPEANNVDPTSPLGISGFSKAVNLIKDADMQYSRLLWEYEAGEMAIDIDRDALNEVQTSDGYHPTMGILQQRLYRKIDLGDSDTYQPYAPILRDAQYSQGLNTILMRIEDNTGLSRGTLSDMTNEAKTATELKMLRQRSYQTNAHIQKAIEDALRDVIYIMNVYATLYNITPEGEYEVSFEWDDSILTDKDDELGKRITLQQNGLASKLENRMWYFGETEVQAQQALLVIEQETMRAIEHDVMKELKFGGGDHPSANDIGSNQLKANKDKVTDNAN